MGRALSGKLSCMGADLVLIHLYYMWILLVSLLLIQAASLMVSGHIFRGNNSVISFMPPFFNRVLLLKKRICSYRSKFFTLKVDPHWEGFHCPWKQTGSLKSSPLKK